MIRYTHCLSMLFAGLLAASASAAVIENFEGPAGTDPAGFNDVADSFALDGSGAYTTSADNGAVPNVVYTPFDPSAADADYTVTATFTFIGTDTSSSTAVSPGSGLPATLPTFGLIARYQSNDNFYEARVDGDTFDILRRNSGGSSILSTASNVLMTNVTYTLAFTLTGDQLSATLVGDNGTNLSIAATNASYSDGEAGLRGRIGAGGTSTAASSLSIDRFTIAVPEPASLALIGLGGLSLLTRRRRA